MSAIGVASIGVRPLAGLLARVTPVVTITSPVGVVSSPSLSFTYSSPVGRAQYSYRFQIRSADGTTILYDSGTVVSSSSAGITIPFIFSGGSAYQVWARASDPFDTSDWATSTISIDLSDVNDFPTEPLVGSVYEIGLNGMGLMLDDNPQNPVRRKLQVLQAPRFATGDTPFSEAVERYTFLGQSSFKGGAGQTYRDRPDSDPTRFLDSWRVNPFEDDALQLVPTMAVLNSDTYSTPYMTLVNERIFIVSGTGTVYSITLAGSGTAGDFSITGAGDPTSMTTDGTYWYYADGANVFRNDTNANPGSAWSSVNAILIRPCLDRMVCTYDNGSGEIVVSTLAPDGTEEVAGGRFAYPDTTEIPDLAAGDGYLWFIVNRGNQSQIHYWKVGTDDTYAAVGLTLPQGQTATALGFYLGNLFIRAVENDGHRCIIYRCLPSDGALTAERVLDFENTDEDLSVGQFAGSDRFVFFTWRNIEPTSGTDYSGVGAIDLSTGGWVRWTGAQVEGTVRSVAASGRYLVISVDGVGLCTNGISDNVDDGYLTTSISDQASGLTKVYDEVRATFDPLLIGTSLSIEYTIDGGNSYTALDADADSSGQQLLTEPVGVEARSIGLKISLAGGSTSTPMLRHVQIKLHALSLADQLVQFPVKCADKMNGLNGRPLPTDAPGGGYKLAKTLEGLIGTRVLLQDVDWPINQTTSVWELVDVDTVLTNTFNPKENRNVISGVATITLRRAT